MGGVRICPNRNRRTKACIRLDLNDGISIYSDQWEMVLIQQLRIYEIFEKNKAAFHIRFRDHAARIMRTRYGFQIIAMWETRFGDRTEFVYLLEWPDEATRSAAWSAFMADAEWTEIKKVTGAADGRMVGAIEDRTLVLTAYSPPFS